MDNNPVFPTVFYLPANICSVVLTSAIIFIKSEKPNPNFNQYGGIDILMGFSEIYALSEELSRNYAIV
jgi:hypothetical protein